MHTGPLYPALRGGIFEAHGSRFAQHRAPKVKTRASSRPGLIPPTKPKGRAVLQLRLIPPPSIYSPSESKGS